MNTQELTPPEKAMTFRLETKEERPKWPSYSRPDYAYGCGYMGGYDEFDDYYMRSGRSTQHRAWAPGVGYYTLPSQTEKDDGYEWWKHLPNEETVGVKPFHPENPPRQYNDSKVVPFSNAALEKKEQDTQGSSHKFVPFQKSEETVDPVIDPDTGLTVTNFHEQMLIIGLANEVYCPHCASRLHLNYNTLRDGYQVNCHACGMNGPIASGADKVEKAIRFYKDMFL